MQTFNDLEFNPHPIDPGGKLAVKIFDNGYGVSVVRFFGSYTSGNEWELAVILKQPGERWMLTYDTPVTNDVIGHLTDDEVTDVMRRVQELPQFETVSA